MKCACNYTITIHYPFKQKWFIYPLTGILIVFAISLIHSFINQPSEHQLQSQLFFVSLLVDVAVTTMSVQSITTSLVLFSFLVMRLLILIITFSDYSHVSHLFKSSNFDKWMYDVILLWFLVTNAMLFILIGLFCICSIILQSKK